MSYKHSKLSWELLEAKIKYYLFPEMFNLTDAQYDKKEKRYMKLCSTLGLPNTIQTMVGVDENRPSVQLAILKIKQKSNA